MIFRHYCTTMIAVVLVSLLCHLTHAQDRSAPEVDICEPVFNEYDFVTEAIALPYPVKIGGCSYNYARVTSNGYITFGSEIYLRKVPIMFEAPMPMIAVFGADLQFGATCYLVTYSPNDHLDSYDRSLPRAQAALFIRILESKLINGAQTNNTNMTQSFAVIIAWVNSTEAYITYVSRSGEVVWSPTVQKEVVIGYSFGARDNPGMQPQIITASPAYARFISNTAFAANFSQYSSITETFSYNISHIPSAAFNGLLERSREIQNGSCNNNYTSSWQSFVEDGVLLPYATETNPYNVNGQYLEFGNDRSSYVTIPSIRFGSCDYQIVQISSNGFVRLLNYESDMMSAVSTGSQLAYEVNPVVAVFAAHMDAGDANGPFSGVFFSLHNQSDDIMHDRVVRRIAQHYGDIGNFQPKVTLVVTYHRVRVEDSANNRITAQLVITSSGSRTYVLLNYADTVHSLRTGSQYDGTFVYIGISYGLGGPPPITIAELPVCHKYRMYAPSDTYTASGIDYMRGEILGNTGLSGRWIYTADTNGTCANSSSRADSSTSDFNLDSIESLLTARWKCLQLCDADADSKIQKINLTNNVLFGPCSYNNATLTSDGAIFLGLPTMFSLRPTRSGNFYLKYPFIAPFSTNISTGYGRICYAEYDNSTGSSFFNSRLSRVNIGFSPTYALAVKWVNVRTKLDQANGSPYTIRMMILSDGNQTGLMFDYSGVNNPFVTSRTNDKLLRIGFSYGTGLISPMFDPQIILSSPQTYGNTEVISRVFRFSNTNVRGVWYWKLNSSSEGCNPNRPVSTNQPSVTSSLPQLTNTLLPHSQASRGYSLSPVCLRNYLADDGYLNFTFPRPFPFGGCNHSVAYISANGFVTLSYPATSIHPTPERLFGPLIAPFNVDLILPNSNSLCYTYHSEGDSYLNEIYNLTRAVNADQMQIKQALVVTWWETQAYSSRRSSSTTFSFQLVLFTDGVNTNFFFTYDRRTVYWYASQFTFGYSYGSILDPSGGQNNLFMYPAAPSSLPSAYSLGNIPSYRGIIGLRYYQPRFISLACATLIQLGMTTMRTTPDIRSTSNLLPSLQNRLNWDFQVPPQTVQQRWRVSNMGCLANEDDRFDSVPLPTPLPFGGCNHTTLHITTNGYVSLTRPQGGTTSALESAETPLLAAFAVDLHPQGYAPVICYTMHSDYDPYLQLIAEKVSQMTPQTAVRLPRFAIAITYYRIPEYGSTSQNMISFQIVIYTDGANTSFFYAYETNNNPVWVASRSRVVVGYSYGTFLDPLQLSSTVNEYPRGRNQLYSTPIYLATELRNRGLPGLMAFDARKFTGVNCVALFTGQLATSTYGPRFSSRAPSNLLPAPQFSDRSQFRVSGCLPPRDDHFESVILPVPLPLGGCNHTLLHVSINGFVSLTNTIQTIRPGNSPQPAPYFAPFSTDLDARASPTAVCYTVHNSEIPPDVTFLNMLADRFPQQLGDFRSRMAVVVTWYNIDEYGGANRASFQLLLVTNGMSTKFFFVYDSNNLPWLLRSNNPVFFGFSYGNLLDPTNYYGFGTNLTTGYVFRNGFDYVSSYQATYVNPNCAAALGLRSTVPPTIEPPMNLFPSPRTSITPYRYSGCLPNRDDYVEQVRLLMPIPFGGCSHSVAFISTNGFVALTRSITALRSALSIAEGPVISPLQTDLHPQNVDTICYTMHPSTDPYLNNIRDRLTLLRKPSMDIQFAFVVTYFRINEYVSGGSTNLATFQIVLFTDSVDTRIIFNYDPLGSYSNLRPPVSAGYTFGSILDPYNRSSNYFDVPASNSLIYSTNTGRSGVWYFQPLNVYGAANCAMLNYSGYYYSSYRPYVTSPVPPTVISRRVDSPPEISPLSTCSQFPRRQPYVTNCRCREPYVGDGTVCRGADPESVMFPYDYRALRSCLLLQGTYSSSDPVFLPQEITFNQLQYSYFSVAASSGYIYLMPNNVRLSSYWPPNSDRYPLIIPYGGSFSPASDASSVCYRIHSSNNSASQPIIDRATQLVRYFTDDANFTARLVLIVTFEKLGRSMDYRTTVRPVAAVTAQAVVISGGPRGPTYVNFNYEFADYVQFAPLRDLVSENPLTQRPDAEMAGFSIPADTYASASASARASYTRFVAISVTENGRLVRAGNSTIVNANAFDQLIGNTGVLGSWLYRVDDFESVNPVTQRAPNPAPQNGSFAFDAPKRLPSNRSASCDGSFTMYARISSTARNLTLRDPFAALDNEMGLYYTEVVQAADGQLQVDSFSTNRFGGRQSRNVNVMFRVNLSCIGSAADVTQFKRESMFRVIITFILTKYGVPIDSQRVDLQEGCWPPRNMTLSSDCASYDPDFWQKELDLFYSGDGFTAIFRRVYYENSKFMVDYGLRGNCTDPVQAQPVVIRCNSGNQPGISQQVAGSSSSSGVAVLSIFLTISVIIAVGAAVYIFKNKIGRIDVAAALQTLRIRRSVPEGFEVPTYSHEQLLRSSSSNIES